MNFEAAYRRLAETVLAYDAAIKLTADTGSGQRWVDGVPELDALYERMLAAARALPDSQTDTTEAGT